MVFRLSDSGFARAVGAAIERVLRLDAMPDDSAAALGADRGQFLNRAFEAVEGRGDAVPGDLEGPGIFVSAVGAGWHGELRGGDESHWRMRAHAAVDPAQGAFAPPPPTTSQPPLLEWHP